MTRTPDTNRTIRTDLPDLRIPHNFTGRREWGIQPDLDKRCVICGITNRVHPRIPGPPSAMQQYLDAIAAEIGGLRDMIYLLAERSTRVIHAHPLTVEQDNPALTADENQAVHIAASLRELTTYARDLAASLALPQ